MIEVRSVTVDIEAPQAFVWEVLLDYARYPEWNPYTVRVESTCVVGDPVDLYLPDPNRPGELMHQREWVCLVDPPHRGTAARIRARVPSDLVAAVRQRQGRDPFPWLRFKNPKP